MTGPLSGSNKPGEEDSWESLAEDLFGIDFHGGSAADDLPDDEEDLAPASTVAEQNDPDDGDAQEFEAGFPEDDEAEAGFSGEETESDAGFSDVVEPAPAKAERSRSAPVAEEKDSFWDALNDWDWSETPRPRKPPVPLTSIVEQHDDDTVESSTSESKDGGGERRRRRRGRRRSSVTEPVTASQEPAPIPQKEPEPLPVLEDEFDLASGDEDDDEFGAGLLEPVRRPSRRPKARPEAEKRPSRRESTEDNAQPTARAERPKQVERAAPPATRPAADEAGFGDDLDEGEQPPRRRRRRRRRSAEPIEGGVSPEKIEIPQPQEDEEPQQRSERPRRRSRSSMDPPGEDTQSSRDVVPRSGAGSGVVPTWAEAIALLVHRHPKQTSGWKPEPDDEDTERPSRPRSNGGRRRRRRPS